MKHQIETFIIAFNEAETIHLTLKHYLSFSRVTLFDNFSEDNTREIALDMGADVKLFGRKGELNDAEYLKIKNHCWKRSRADFVIVVDADEILEKPTVFDGTIFKTKGFNVYSHEMPKTSFFEINSGVWDDNYSKTVIFSPQHVSEINYHYGCHTSNPHGDIRLCSQSLILYHYKNIGGPDRIYKRHLMYARRMGYLNNHLGLGHHYLHSKDRQYKDWNDYYNKSIQI